MHQYRTTTFYFSFYILIANATKNLLVEDKEEKDRIVSVFRSTVKAYKYFFHIVYLETFKYAEIRLVIRKRSFIRFQSKELTVV